MTKVAQAIRCAKCKAALPAEWIPVSSPDQKCPKCGAFEQEVLMEIIEDVAVEAHDNVRLKVKDPALSGKKNPRLDQFAGADLRKSDGRWMQKERIIDRDRDYYKEVVIDPSDGTVVHKNEEPLSEHFGHGSAKTKPPAGEA